MGLKSDPLDWVLTMMKKLPMLFTKPFSLLILVFGVEEWTF
jgi:hypothetical protein